MLPVRTKINNVTGMLQIAQTDAVISAGATTSLPIAAIAGNLMVAGETIMLLDINTGEAHDLTLNDNLENGDEVITITSYVFASDIPSGSPIYFKLTNLLTRTFPV